MARANKLVFILVLAAIFAYSGCSGRHNPPPGGGEQFSLDITLPADIAKTLPDWLNHLGGRVTKSQVREIVPYANCIDIYVHNPNDPTDNTKITKNLTPGQETISVPCTVNSTGPYTIEVFASAVIDADLSICFTAGRVTGAVPGSGPVYITLERLVYTKGTAPDTLVTVGGTLSMSGILESPVPVNAATIDMVYAQFNAAGSDNFFILPASNFTSFNPGSGQSLSFGGPVQPLYALTGATDFSCDAIGILFTHPGLGKTYELFYWAGNVEDPEAIHMVKVQPAGEKAWNFLVYLDGDNDLEDQAIADLNEMERIGSTDAVNVLALVDRNPNYDSTNGNWTSTRLYYITRDYDTGWINSTLIADYGELDMSDPNTLRNFIVHCQENFPAARTVLTLWNHGAGVYPRTGAKSRKPQPPDPFGSSTGGARGLCWDETTGSSPWNCLTTDEVASALADAYARTGQKIDIINMDVCLCQMLEVAWEWQGLTDYLVGSEETVPGTGNDYRAILARLTGNPGMATAAYARGLVDDYAALYAGLDTTYSCIDLGAPFASLRSSFITFAHALNVTTDLAAAHLAAAYYGTHFSYYENIDLYGFAADLAALTGDTAVKNAANALMAAIEGAVYYKNTGDYINAANGIAILLADYSTWPYYSDPSRYRTLKLCKDTEWDEFILDFAAGSEVDTLTATISWDSGDCDLYVEDHGGLYSPFDGVSPNGVFSADSMNGGSESWTLNQPHAPGMYSFLVRSFNYEGNVDYNVVINGVDHTGTVVVDDNPFVGYYFYHNYTRNRIEVKAIDISTLPEFALPEK